MLQTQSEARQINSQRMRPLERLRFRRMVRHECIKVPHISDTLNLSNRTDIESFDGLHEINGKGTFEFLHKQLNWPKP